MYHSQLVEQTAYRVQSSPPALDPAVENVHAAHDTPAIEPVTQAQLERRESARERMPLDEPRTPAGRGRVARLILACFKRLTTLAIALAAIVMALVTWDYYVTAPWTRDGRVRVQVASLAPQVSGQIIELWVGDNQYVRKGDVLYVIDPFDFEVVLQVARAQLQQRAADLQVKEMQSERRQRLSSLATTPEEQQTYAGAAVQAKAAFEAAQQQVAQAELNLRRTRVLSSVNGYVTNLQMRVGDYAREGVADIWIIDTDSYWVDGYFEETKMARVCIGDQTEVQLMGYAVPILGHVASVTRGIGVSDAAAGAQGLPSVNPVYTWVRLAQRVPVRIAIDYVPPDTPLVSGLSATVTIKQQPVAVDSQFWLDRAIAEAETRLSEVLVRPPARRGCIPVTTTARATPESLPAGTPKPGASPEQINPGLAPSVNAPPRKRG
jgi:multidrug resistance efflux pump